MFETLSSANVADACVQLGVALRAARPRPIVSGWRVAGPVCAVRHYGSVDVFLEALDASVPGDVLVIDNAGRLDEACIGDLVTIEARAAGVAGIIVWGCHRDTAEIREIGLPVFSLGATPTGPVRLDLRIDALKRFRVGDWDVDDTDVVVADDDGVLFVPGEDAQRIEEAALSIRRIEAKQAAAVGEGRCLREQLHFAAYIERRQREPSFTFRSHLRSLGAAIEEGFHC